jgi:hypothetical protein
LFSNEGTRSSRGGDRVSSSRSTVIEGSCLYFEPLIVLESRADVSFVVLIVYGVEDIGHKPEEKGKAEGQAQHQTHRAVQKSGAGIHKCLERGFCGDRRDCGEGGDGQGS